MYRKRLWFCALVALVFVSFLGQSAFSMFALPQPPFSEDVVITFSAESNGHAGQVDFFISPEEWVLLNPADSIVNYRWDFDIGLDNIISIPDNTNPEIILGSIDTFSLTVKQDPSVSLNFSATAGNSDTTLGFSSAFLSRPLPILMR